MVYYPLSGTMLFSGFLGCGSIPILGGRPYEILCEHKKAARTLKDVERQNSQLRSTPSDISTLPSSSFGGGSSESQHTRRVRKPSRKLQNEVRQQTNFLSSLPPQTLEEPAIDLERGESNVEVLEDEPEPMAPSKRASSKPARSSSRKKGLQTEDGAISVEKAAQEPVHPKRSSSRTRAASSPIEDSTQSNTKTDRSKRSSSSKRHTSKHNHETEATKAEKSSSKSKRSSSRKRSTTEKKDPDPTPEPSQSNMGEPELSKRRTSRPKSQDKSASADRKLLEP